MAAKWNPSLLELEGGPGRKVILRRSGGKEIWEWSSGVGRDGIDIGGKGIRKGSILWNKYVRGNLKYERFPRDIGSWGFGV